MEFFAEFLLEIYMELMFLIVPKAKKGNKKYKVIATLIAIAVLLGVAALALWGAELQKPSFRVHSTRKEGFYYMMSLCAKNFENAIDKGKQW